MEIRPEVTALITELSQRSAAAQHAARRAETEQERDRELATADADEQRVLETYYGGELQLIDAPAGVQATAEQVAVELRNQVARLPAPAPPPPLAQISRHELMSNHPACRYAWWESDVFSGPDVNARAQKIAAKMNEQRSRYHQRRVEELYRDAYASAHGVSPNLLCFTDFQRLAAAGAQRTTSPRRIAMPAAHRDAVQEARVIAQGAAVYLRRRAKVTPGVLRFALWSLSPFHGMAMERAALLAAAIGSEGPAAGMIHALYGALFTSADYYLNERERADFNGAHIHLTHASHIFGAFCAHNGNISFDPPLEALVTKMRDDIDAGRDIGPIEPIIYALADALTNY